jgi:PelA/Pel-15E family pectate lyase
MGKIERAAPRVFQGIAAAAMLLSMLTGVSPGQRAEREGGSRLRWPDAFDEPDEFYASDEAIRIADNLLLYQRSNGGWPKNVDMARVLNEREKARLTRDRDGQSLIDNGATHTQIRFLALVHSAAGEERFAEAARRGVEFLLKSQYDNGGWPQISPLEDDYSRHITFNDNAMIGVMRLLRDVAKGKAPYQFLDQAIRDRAASAVARGVDVILKCQVVVDGKPTVWCAQHDERTFAPAKARAYELPSLSGSESVGIVRFLMGIDDPSPEIRTAIHGAVAWFEAVKIMGQRVERVRAPELDPPRDVIVVEDPDAEPLWARFYEIGTNRPMFVGRDGVVKHQLADIEHERRMGYAYLGDWADELLERDYPAWQKKWGEEK